MTESLTEAVAQTRAKCNQWMSNNLLTGVDNGLWTLADAWEAVQATHDDNLWDAFCDAVDARDGS